MQALKTVKRSLLVLSAAFFTVVLAGNSAWGVDVPQEKAQAATSQTSPLESVSNALREVASKVSPAVVEVRVTKKISMRSPGVGLDMDEFLRRFFGEQGPGPGQAPMRPSPDRRGREFVRTGIGSGVIVDARQGYIITNYHVVAGVKASDVEIVLADERKPTVEKIWTDPPSDLAVIKVKAQNLTDAPLGDSDLMQVGDFVLAFGSPEALSQTVTMGIISAKGRTTGRGNYESFLQTDAAINQGNSGGPLANMKGQVIGINTAIISRAGTNEGIGFAIPSNMVKWVMKQLIDKGKVTRGYLGVLIQDIDEDLAKSFNLPSDVKGAIVSEVSADSPAEKAGVKPGDVILQVGGRKIADMNELRNTVASIEPDTKVEIKVFRDGKTKELEATIGQLSKNAIAAAPYEEEQAPAQNAFGLEVGKVTADAIRGYGYKGTPKGIIIEDVSLGSDAAQKGLIAGMIITHVKDAPVASPEEFSEAISKPEFKEGVRLTVKDPTGTRFVFIRPAKSE